MIKPIALKTLVDRYGGCLTDGDCQFGGVSTDTRQLKSGELFIALNGTKHNAHNFLSAAADRGACGLVIQERQDDTSLPCWLVKDTLKALAQIASLQRENYHGKLVAVTGSSGKTTVKGLLASILSTHSIRYGNGRESVFATKGNLNSRIGLPLSLLSLNAQHRLAVIEMGADAVGNIDYLTHIAKPHIALINNVMPAHVEGFGSIENIARAKGEIFNGLPHDGIAIINRDDRYAKQWLEQNSNRRCLTFSAAKKGADINVWAENITADDQGYYHFDLCSSDGAVKVQLSLLGLHNVNNALAAAACSIALDIDLADISNGINAFSGDQGRLQAIEGYNQSILLDDSYNANPGSVAAAIDVLAYYRQKKILILGDMCELGDSAEKFHRQTGRYANEKQIDRLFTFGQLSRFCQDSFSGSGDHFDQLNDLIGTVKSEVNSNSVVLIKGSRSSQMDKVVAALSEPRAIN